MVDYDEDYDETVRVTDNINFDVDRELSEETKLTDNVSYDIERELSNVSRLSTKITFDIDKLLTEELRIDDGSDAVSSRRFDNFELSDSLNFFITRELTEILELVEDVSIDINREVAPIINLSTKVTLIHKDSAGNIINIVRDNCILSSRRKFRIYSGTYQQVVNILDVEQIPEHKVKGFMFVKAGECGVLVHTH
jgi:hypothetical protein